MPQSKYIYNTPLSELRETAREAVKEGRLPEFYKQILYRFKSVQVTEEEFEKLLEATKTILGLQRLSSNVLVKQLLKRKIVRNRALVNAFLSRAVAAGYLMKRRNGRKVYHSLVDEEGDSL
jgi:hypothetical protein